MWSTYEIGEPHFESYIEWKRFWPLDQMMRPMMDRLESLLSISDNVMKLQSQLIRHLIDHEEFDELAALKTGEWATEFLNKYVRNLGKRG